MLVRNASVKTLGFGDKYIVPGEVGELPKGFGKQHPTVNYFLSKGWLTIVEAKKKSSKESDKKVTIEEKLDKLSKMQLVHLREEANNLGIEFNDADTEEVLVEKITAKLKAE